MEARVDAMVSLSGTTPISLDLDACVPKSGITGGDESAVQNHQHQNFFSGMKFVVDESGLSKDKMGYWSSLIQEHGGEYTNTVTTETTHLITTMAQVASSSAMIEAALKNGKQRTLILSEQFLTDCLQQNRLCPPSSYLIPNEAAGYPSPSSSPPDTPSSSPSSSAASSVGDEAHEQEEENYQEKDSQKEEVIEDTANEEHVQKIDIDIEKIEEEELHDDDEDEEEGDTRDSKEDDGIEDFDLFDDTVIVQERSESAFVANFFEEEESTDAMRFHVPGVKLWKYREFGAPYFPHSYEIERMDILIQQAGVSAQPRKFFVIEQHVGDYFGKQCHRLFVHLGNMEDVSTEEKWCLYIEDRQDIVYKYQEIIEERLNNKQIPYEHVFIAPHTLIVGSDLTREYLEMGWLLVGRLLAYTETPNMADGLDLVEQLKEAFLKCRPASPLCLILQCPEMVSLLLRNSFLSLNAECGVDDKTEKKEDEEEGRGKEGKESEKEGKEVNEKVEQGNEGVVIGDDEDILMHDDNNNNMSAEEVRKEMEMAWREVFFLLIDSGIHFNGYYKEKHILPIFDQLAQHAQLCLQQLLEPFFELYASHNSNENGEGESVRKINTTVGRIIPLGKRRLCSIKFASVLVKAQNEIGIEELLTKEVPILPSTNTTATTAATTTPTLSLLRCAIESFFAFPWNNVLHCHVVEIVQEIFGAHSPHGEEDCEGFYGNFVRKATHLERYILEECYLLHSILKVHEEEDRYLQQQDDEEEEEEEEQERSFEGEEGNRKRKRRGRAPRRGNLGHITEISNAIVERGDSLFQEFFNKDEEEGEEGRKKRWPEVLEQWRHFVDTKLKAINEAENATFFKPKAFYVHNYWSF